MSNFHAYCYNLTEKYAIVNIDFLKNKTDILNIYSRYTHLINICVCWKVDNFHLKSFACVVKSNIISISAYTKLTKC